MTLLLATLLALTVADLEPLPDNEQVQLTPKAFDESVQSCVQAMDAPALYCGCVVRGFEMFLPRSDWDRVHHGLKAQHTGIILQIEMACRAAAVPHVD